MHASDTVLQVCVLAEAIFGSNTRSFNHDQRFLCQYASAPTFFDRG